MHATDSLTVVDTGPIPRPQTTDPQVAAAIYASSGRQRIQTLLAARDREIAAFASVERNALVILKAELEELWSSARDLGDDARLTLALRVLRRHGGRFGRTWAEHQHVVAGIDRKVAAAQAALAGETPAVRVNLRAVR